MTKKLTWIALEGNIGSGKTTAAKALAMHLGGTLMLEDFEDNPYLEQFYQQKKIPLLKLETHFLVERYYQIRATLERSTTGILISDYNFLKCLVFARVNLPAHELPAFETLFKFLHEQLPQPDITVYLKLEISDLINQIAARGRIMEHAIDFVYLEQINKAYDNNLLNLEKGQSVKIIDGKPLFKLPMESLSMRLMEQLKAVETK